jgi:cysteine desulfurase
MALDLSDIAASSASACGTGQVHPSHVLAALGTPEDLARGALRFTLGRTTTEADVSRLLAVLPPILDRLRPG